MRKQCLIGIAIVALMVGLTGCFPADPIDDIYTKNIFPGSEGITGGNYQIGNEANPYEEGYFGSIHVRESTIYFDSHPLTLEGANETTYLRGDLTWQPIEGESGHTHANLSTLDLIDAAFTTALKAAYDNAVSLSHSHSNKDILDATTAVFTTALKSAYDAAVSASHSHSNKSILDATQEAFTISLKSAYDDAVSKGHTHTNKATLDLIEEAFTTALKNKLDSIEANAVSLGTVKADADIADAIAKKHSHSNQSVLDLITEPFTTALKTAYDNAVSLAHSHANKSLLDTYSQTEANLADAVTQKHSHSNKSILDATQESFTTSLKTSYDWLVTNITSAWKSTVDNFIASKGQASGLASLNSSTLVVENPANATATPGASKIPISDADSYINQGWLGSGTPSSSTYLRGDQSWVTISGSNYRNLVTLSADSINNNSTANTLQNCGDLNFSVTAGTTYRFYALTIYTSAATTTGSRWTINGPASPALLSYTSRYYSSGATAAIVQNIANAYQLPASCCTYSAYTTSNIAEIQGIIIPSSNGTVTIQFASEVSGSAITAKAGSTLEWW